MGIEKITDRIMDDANDYESEMMNNAQKEINEIVQNYKGRAEAVSNEIIERGKKNAAAILSRAESGALLAKRNQVLKMKSNLIDNVFETAEERVASMPEDDLLTLLLNILISAAESGEGTVIFNKRDKSNFGAKFVAAANKQIKEVKKSSKFVLSDDTADIKNGFILKYGDIETNCSIEKIIAAKKALLEPQVIRILFEDKNTVTAKKRK